MSFALLGICREGESESETRLTEIKDEMCDSEAERLDSYLV